MDEDYKLVTKRAFDEMARDYARRDQAVIDGTFEVKTVLEKFISALPPQGKVLEIGSGGGRDSRFLFDRGFSVVGIDISEKMVESAREIQPKIDYRVMDFEMLNFPINLFNGVWANASLHHIPKANLGPVLQSIYVILKLDGLLGLKIKHGNQDGFRINEKFGHTVRRYFAFYQSEELSELLKEAGFIVHEAEVNQSGEWLNILAQKA